MPVSLDANSTAVGTAMEGVAMVPRVIDADSPFFFAWEPSESTTKLRHDADGAIGVGHDADLVLGATWVAAVSACRGDWRGCC